MKRKPLISAQLRQQIRKEVQSGKSKYQTAKELGVSQKTVYRHTKDLPSKPYGWPGIRGKTLEILQEIILKGYHICSQEGSNKRFFQLKKNFPTMYRAKMNKMTIYYLAGREDDAARAFLGNIGKKIISYQVLTNITDVFHANLSKSEKQAFLSKKEPKKALKITGQKEDFLGEKDDSLAYFYIRKYCTPVVPKVEYENYRDGQNWHSWSFL